VPRPVFFAAGFLPLRAVRATVVVPAMLFVPRLAFRAGRRVSVFLREPVAFCLLSLVRATLV
jgi:hypothetical protein